MNITRPRRPISDRDIHELAPATAPSSPRCDLVKEVIPTLHYIRDENDIDKAHRQTDRRELFYDHIRKTNRLNIQIRH